MAQEANLVKGEGPACSAGTQGSTQRLTALSVKDGQLGRVTEMLEEERWIGEEMKEVGLRNSGVKAPATTPALSSIHNQQSLGL